MRANCRVSGSWITFATLPLCGFARNELTARQISRKAANEQSGKDYMSTTPFLVLIVRCLPPALVIDHAAKDAVQLHVRPKTHQRIHFRNVRNAARHIFEAFFISFVIRNKDYLGIRPSQFFYTLGQLEDRDLLVGADIEDFAYCLIMVD